MKAEAMQTLEAQDGAAYHRRDAPRVHGGSSAYECHALASSRGSAEASRSHCILRQWRQVRHARRVYGDCSIEVE